MELERKGWRKDAAAAIPLPLAREVHRFGKCCVAYGERTPSVCVGLGWGASSSQRGEGLEWLAVPFQNMVILCHSTDLAYLFGHILDPAETSVCQKPACIRN